MMIANGCLFSHIPKTAGTSIRQAMMEIPNCMYLGKIEDSNINIRKAPNWYNPHLTPEVLSHTIPKYITDYLWKFTIVRNPWDRFVSWHAWNYRTKRRKDSFSVFLKKLLKEDSLKRRAITQSEFLDSPMFFDFVGTYEHLETDWQVIQQQLHIHTPLPVLNVSNHSAYQDYYTPELKDLVLKHEYKLIEMLQYRFED